MLIVIPTTKSSNHLYKTNIITTWGTCANCGRTRGLDNYDFRSAGEQKHARNRCGSCLVSEVYRQTDWQGKYDREIPAAISTYERNLDSRDHAVDLLHKIAFFHDKESLERLGPLMAERIFDGDFSGLLAATYLLMMMPAKAKAVLQGAIARGHDLNHQYMMLCLYSGEVEECHAYVINALETGHTNAQELSFLLAEGYQRKGDHSQAREILELVKKALPRASRTADYKYLRKLSRKYGITSTPCNGRRLLCGPPKKVPMALMDKLLMWGIPSAAIVLYVILAASTSASIFLVGGYHSGYEVSVNGKKVSVPKYADSPTQVNVGWQEFTVSPTSNGPQFETMRGRHDTFFLWRPFYSTVYVVTPDAQSAILHVTLTYAERADVPPKFDLRAGQVLHEFNSIDHAFSEPPDTVDLGESGSPEIRTWLRLLRPEELQDLRAQAEQE